MLHRVVLEKHLVKEIFIEADNVENAEAKAILGLKLNSYECVEWNHARTYLSVGYNNNFQQIYEADIGYLDK